MYRYLWIVLIAFGLTMSGCAQKKEWRSYIPFMKKKESTHTSKRIKVQKKRKGLQYSKKYRLYFPPTIKKPAISPSQVVIFHEPQPGCSNAGWLTFYLQPPLRYKSTMLKDILRLKREEERQIRRQAAAHGIRYIYNNLDERSMRYDYVYDPKLKAKCKVVVTPHKRMLINQNKIYKISVRALECNSKKGRKQ